MAPMGSGGKCAALLPRRRTAGSPAGVVRMSHNLEIARVSLSRSASSRGEKRAESAAAGISDAEVAQENRIGAAFVGWISGCVVIWSSLFAIGNFLYASGDPSRLKTAWSLPAVLAVSGFVLLRVTQQLWTDSTASQAREDARVARG